jgi:hypothetical protein
VKLAIADPPYPPHYSYRYDTATGVPRLVTRSRARRWYGDGPRDLGGAKPADFHHAAGEWDAPARHRRLLEDLEAGYDGWAIATTMDGLQHYMPLPVPARILIWHKPRAMPTAHRIAHTCEAVIVCAPRARRARPLTGQVPDLLTTPAPGDGFAGAKPRAWTLWVLDALGYDPAVDEVDDLFPGSGAITRAAQVLL